MQVYQIVKVAVLTILLNFNPAIVWADKKTTIIAGSAGGGAAAVIGGVLSYKFYNEGVSLNFEFKDGKLMSDEVVLKEFEHRLYSKEFNNTIIKKIISKIAQDIVDFNGLGKKSEFKYLIKKNKVGATIKTEIKINGTLEKNISEHLREPSLLDFNNDEMTSSIVSDDDVFASMDRHFLWDPEGINVLEDGL